MTPECRAKFDKLYLDQDVITFPLLNKVSSDKEQLIYDVIPVYREVVEHIFAQGWKAGKDYSQPQPFHAGADVYIIDANNPLPKPMPLSIAEQVQFADTGKVMNSPNNSNGWISVKERLPEIPDNRSMSEDVLWLTRYGEMEVSCLERLRSEFRVDWGEAGLLKLDQFTHWMPLPTLPKEEK